jgi:phosphatidylserine decarboxylase
MRWSGLPCVSNVRGRSTRNNARSPENSVVEWPCLLAEFTLRASLMGYILRGMVKEGYYFGLPLLVLGGAAYLAQWTIAAVVFVCVAIFVFSFFRDPERVIPAEPGAIVSPGDGRVVVVTEEDDAGRPGKRISIFLAVWNVHVNRAPAAGVITKMEYRPGKFLAAMRERASMENEQNVFTLSTDAGEMVFKQIAGLIARRVVSWKKEGERVARGERIGLVRFGSRVDIWVPKDAEILVRVGENVKGGSSVVARWPAKTSSLNVGEQERSDAEANVSAVGRQN